MSLVIAPSILSADFARSAPRSRPSSLPERIGSTSMSMDGHFVPNITIGPGIVKALRPHSQAVLRCPSDDRAVRSFRRRLRRSWRRSHLRSRRGRAASSPLAAGDPRRSARRQASCSIRRRLSAASNMYSISSISCSSCRSIPASAARPSFLRRWRRSLRLKALIGYAADPP